MSGFATYPSLKDRVVLITGGAGGIGAAHVAEFCAQGARVGFIDYDAESAGKVVETVRANGHAAPDFLQVDLRDIPALEAAIAGFVAKAGPVTVLLNNAAHDQRHKLDDVTSAYFDERIAYNLKHMLFCAKAVVPGMRAAGGVAASSTSARFPGGWGWRGYRSMSPPRPGSRG